MLVTDEKQIPEAFQSFGGQIPAGCEAFLRRSFGDADRQIERA